MSDILVLDTTALNNLVKQYTHIVEGEINKIDNNILYVYNK